MTDTSDRQARQDIFQRARRGLGIIDNRSTIHSTAVCVYCGTPTQRTYSNPAMTEWDSPTEIVGASHVPHCEVTSDRQEITQERDYQCPECGTVNPHDVVNPLVGPGGLRSIATTLDIANMGEGDPHAVEAIARVARLLDEYADRGAGIYSKPD